MLAKTADRLAGARLSVKERLAKRRVAAWADEHSSRKRLGCQVARLRWAGRPV